MEFIQDLTVFLLILVPIGAAARIAACMIYMQMEEDPMPYRKKIRNVLIYAVVSECIIGLIPGLLGYFGGGVIT